MGRQGGRRSSPSEPYRERHSLLERKEYIAAKTSVLQSGSQRSTPSSVRPNLVPGAIHLTLLFLYIIFKAEIIDLPNRVVERTE